MLPTQILPPDYHSIGAIDLKDNGRALLWLNVLGLLLFFLSGFIFVMVLAWLRPDETGPVLALDLGSAASVLQAALAFLALYALMIVLHEAIHGLFFWLYTRQRPVFAFKWSYAYAAAPSWYLPRNQYLVTAISPFVGISALAVLLMAFVPAAWFLPILVVATGNASGAIGDLWVAGWLLRQPPACYAQDRGDSVTLYLSMGLD
jgi:hypothetical protein